MRGAVKRALASGPTRLVEQRRRNDKKAGRQASNGVDPRPIAALSERVAQSVEHLTFNQGVPGSSPGALTKEIKYL